MSPVSKEAEFTRDGHAITCETVTLLSLVIPYHCKPSGREKGGEERYSLRAALCRGGHLEGQSPKFGRFWRIGVCIAGRIQRVLQSTLMPTL